MDSVSQNPLFKPMNLFVVALSLSIGWGIRGNFGHESGAMIAGALAAIAACLLSGREDWRERVAYFALFGGLGWGFGGSIAYMYTVSFTASGNLYTTWYGYFAMFLVGGLWAGMGGAGTALPAVAQRERLTKMFVPLLFALGALTLHKFIEEPIEELLMTPAAAGMDATWNRHKSPLYWMDADWFSALMVVLGICVYDLWDRKFAKASLLAGFTAAGALGGFFLQKVFDLTGISPLIVRLLVVPLGDVAALDPDTGSPFSHDDLLNNWPQFFGDYSQHLGWGLGLLLGFGLYFYLHGQWTRDAKLFLYLSLGWLLSFLLLPVLGTIPLQSVGGLRLTPPRSDDWAGILGVFIGMSIYTYRNGLAPVTYAGAVSGILGGILFASMQMVRSLLVYPGHPYRNGGTAPPEWAHYQNSNWHSVLEQSQGFGHGIAIALMLGLLWSKIPPHPAEPKTRRWTEIFSVGFVVFFMTYLNQIKNVDEWVRGQTPIVPELMKMPLVRGIEWTAATWFQLAWCAIALSFVGLMTYHLRKKRLEIVPATWLGKGQLIFVLLLWIMVVGNTMRALPNFSSGRLITEWVIILNACLATFLVAVRPTSAARTARVNEPASWGRLLGSTWVKGLVVAAFLMTLYTGIIRIAYRDTTIFAPEHSHKRFGPEATWRIHPILKNKKHM